MVAPVVDVEIADVFVATAAAAAGVAVDDDPRSN
jgi:hypothetical protein